MAPTRRRSRSVSTTAFSRVRYCLRPLRHRRRRPPSPQTPPTRPSLMAPERRRGRSASHPVTTQAQILPDGWSSSPRRGSPVPLANPIKVGAIGGDGDGNMPSGKHAPLPSHLLKFLKDEGENARGDEVKLIALVVHALFLDNGFVSFDSPQQGWPASITTKSLELRYTLPSLLHLHPTSVDSIDLRFETSGKLVCISGRVHGVGSSSASLVLDTSRYGVWRTMYMWEDLPTLDHSKKEVVIAVLKMIKDRLLLPLHIDICDKAGLPSPPCFMRLPTDIQIKILELLPWSDLAKMACVCSAMKRLASDDELWKQRYGEVLGEVGMACAGETSWKDMFGASMRRKKVMEIEMARRRFHGPWWQLTPRPHPQSGVVAYETDETEETDDEDDDEDDSNFKPPSPVLTYDNAYESSEDDWPPPAMLRYDTYEETRSFEQQLVDPFEQQLEHQLVDAWTFPSFC